MKDFTHLLRITLLFIPMAWIGTLTHELGHIAVAQFLGYETALSYASMHSTGPVDDRLQELWEAFGKETERMSPKQKAEWENLKRQQRYESTLIRLGGPLQTMLTGTLGLFLLWRLRSRPERKEATSLNPMEWGALLLTLFWSRQVFNGLSGIISSIFSSRTTLRGDEILLSHYWQLPLWSISLGTALVGLAICTLAVFRLTPRQQKWPLLIGGSVGSLIGYTLWMGLLGPALLP